MKHDSVYDQPTSMASAGTTAQPGKPDTCDDAKSNPSRFSRNASTVATPDPNSELDTLRELQLGSNGYQSNGYHPHSFASPVPTRGFGKTAGDTGGFQGK